MTTMQLRLLLVEDTLEDALLIQRALTRGGFQVIGDRVDNAVDMRRQLMEHEWDVVIADFSLPDFSGLAAFEIYRQAGIDVPFILVSGSIGEETAVEAMRAGIHDYVLKGNLARLAPAIERELREASVRRARAAAEEQLRKTERLRMIGELVSSIVHDFKNPLQSILMSADLMCDEMSDSEDRLHYGEIIERQVMRVIAMSDDVLDFVRGDVHLRMNPMNPVTLVRELVETCQPAFSEQNVELSCGFERVEDIPTIVADDQKIWRVLQNLIGNAKDAMPNGGKIDVRVSHRQGYVLIEVEDTGGGIPDEIRDTLFDPFVTRGKRNGTGLGLAIVRSMVEAHDGFVTYSVNEGVGTTFSVRFPVRAEELSKHLLMANVTESGR